MNGRIVFLGFSFVATILSLWLFLPWNLLLLRLTPLPDSAQEQVEQAARLADLLRDLRVAEAVFSSALAQLDTNKSDPFASYPLVQTLEAPSLPRAASPPSALLVTLGAIAASMVLTIGFLLLWLRQPIIRKLLPNA